MAFVNGSRRGVSSRIAGASDELRARVAAFSLDSRYDPRQTTAKARASFASSFERLVDPDRKLPLAEDTSA